MYSRKLHKLILLLKRFVNAIGVHALALMIADERGNKCEMQEVAIDGVYLDKPRVPLFGKSLLITGGRLDWLVRCEKPGTYSVGFFLYKFSIFISSITIQSK